ncbi:MAG: MarR family transcriptional regulator [Streptosporangiaceae bacterium]|jgi:DNA-binding MarR family transcriptional regulator
MADGDYYDVWLDMLERQSPARFVELILDRAGVSLSAELCRYLVIIDLRGPIGVVELAELVESNHPKASRTLAQLEELGLVKRAEAPHDRRIKTTTLTREGRQVVAAINQGRRRVLAEAFADWDERDQAELARLTARFADAIFKLTDVM